MVRTTIDLDFPYDLAELLESAAITGRGVEHRSALLESLKSAPAMGRAEITADRRSLRWLLRWLDESAEAAIAASDPRLTIYHRANVEHWGNMIAEQL